VCGVSSFKEENVSTKVWEHPNRPHPVSVRELRQALETYPDDALVYTYENGTGGGGFGVDVDGKNLTVWNGITYHDNWHEPEYINFDAERPRKWNESR